LTPKTIWRVENPNSALKTITLRLIYSHFCGSVTEEQIFSFLSSRGAELSAPYHNGERPYVLRTTASETSWEVLWKFGHCPAAGELKTSGEDPGLVSKKMELLKSYFVITELKDVMIFLQDFSKKLKLDFDKAIQNEEPIKKLRLDERWIKSITEFCVEMYTDENKHRGRPHVVVYLKNGKIRRLYI
jgi:hypothetical protein